jgi:hypothetical protein
MHQGTGRRTALTNGTLRDLLLDWHACTRGGGTDACMQETPLQVGSPMQLISNPTAETSEGARTSLKGDHEEMQVYCVTCVHARGRAAYIVNVT